VRVVALVGLVLDVGDRDGDPALALLGALSIVSNARYSASPLSARYFVIAAVRLVLPWSM